MAIKISGTTVIDNSRNLTNIGTTSLSSNLTVLGDISDGTNVIPAQMLISCMPKSFCSFDKSVSPLVIDENYNVSSVTDTTTGQATVTYTNNFNSLTTSHDGASRNTRAMQIVFKGTNVVGVIMRSFSNYNSYDEEKNFVSSLGDLA